MSLNWNLKSVKPEYREFIKSDEPSGWRITNWLIMSLGALGAGSITAKNWKEVYARLKVIEALDGDDFNITADDIYWRIGLETNWMFEDEPRSKWVACVVGLRLDANVRKAEKEVALV